MKYKTLPASFKAPPTYSTDEREFEAIVSVFNNVDQGGDIVRPGAFKDTIAAWKQSGDKMPVLWSHRMDHPEFNIGSVEDISEVTPGDARIPEYASAWIQDNGGLWVKGSVDVENNPTAGMVWNLLSKRRVTQFSFAYEVLEERAAREGNELLKLWLYEVGPTPLGMNPLTELIGAKSDATVTSPPEKALPSAGLLRLRCDIDIAAYVD